MTLSLKVGMCSATRNHWDRQGIHVHTCHTDENDRLVAYMMVCMMLSTQHMTPRELRALPTSSGYGAAWLLFVTQSQSRDEVNRYRGMHVMRLVICYEDETMRILFIYRMINTKVYWLGLAITRNTTIYTICLGLAKNDKVRTHNRTKHQEVK